MAPSIGGDNTTPTSVQVTSSAAGSYAVNAAHTYSQFGSFTISVSLTSSIVGPITATGTATVSTFTLTVNNLTAHAGQPFNTLVATLKGTVSAQGLRVNIEWGDNSLISKLTLPGGTSITKIISGHTYSQAGTYTMIIILVDLGTGEQTHANGTVTVV